MARRLSLPATVPCRGALFPRGVELAGRAAGGLCTPPWSTHQETTHRRHPHRLGRLYAHMHICIYAHMHIPSRPLDMRAPSARAEPSVRFPTRGRYHGGACGSCVTSWLRWRRRSLWELATMEERRRRRRRSGQGHIPRSGRQGRLMVVSSLMARGACAERYDCG